MLFLFSPFCLEEREREIWKEQGRKKKKNMSPSVSISLSLSLGWVYICPIDHQFATNKYKKTMEFTNLLFFFLSESPLSRVSDATACEIEDQGSRFGSCEGLLGSSSLRRKDRHWFCNELMILWP